MFGWCVIFVCLLCFEVYFWFPVMSQVKNNKKAKGPQWVLTSPWSVSTTKEVTFPDVEYHSWLPSTELMLQVRRVDIEDKHQYQRREWKPRASPESWAQWMARGLLKFPSVRNCINNNLVHGSEWASTDKGMKRSISGTREKLELLIRNWNRLPLYRLDIYDQNWGKGMRMSIRHLGLFQWNSYWTPLVKGINPHTHTHTHISTYLPQNVHRA